MSEHKGGFNIYSESFIQLCDEKLNCAYCHRVLKNFLKMRILKHRNNFCSSTKEVTSIQLICPIDPIRPIFSTQNLRVRLSNLFMSMSYSAIKELLEKKMHIFFSFDIDDIFGENQLVIHLIVSNRLNKNTIRNFRNTIDSGVARLTLNEPSFEHRPSNHLLENLCLSADLSRFKLHLSQLPNTIKEELIILTTSNFSPLFIAGDGRIMDDFHRHHFLYESEAK